ncbi:hypothetical protein ZIOFF_006017 [Zingiber officinale]|uniref:Uncharacterized protein n=1 Tax=Zingiber officinale TaxID=94328 RepID=A0A8J5HX00_ZINOF|nr:hypothetical protein ZIOFF_006017 [Zingiber officinale]
MWSRHLDRFCQMGRPNPLIGTYDNRRQRPFKGEGKGKNVSPSTHHSRIPSLPPQTPDYYGKHIAHTTQKSTAMDASSVVCVTLFVALLCACILIGHLLEGWHCHRGHRLLLVFLSTSVIIFVFIGTECAVELTLLVSGIVCRYGDTVDYKMEKLKDTFL